MRREKIVKQRYGKFAIQTVADKLPQIPLTAQAQREIAELRVIEAHLEQDGVRGQAIAIAYQFRVGFNNSMQPNMWAVAVRHPQVPGHWQAITHGFGVPPLDLRWHIPLSIQDMFVHPSMLDAMYQHVIGQNATFAKVA